MPAHPNNQYAAKPAEEQRSSVVYVRVTRAEKAAMVKAASGETLSDWARRQLLRAAGEREQDQDHE